MKSLHVVRLQPSDAHSYRNLRLSALCIHPESFGASVAEESALSEEAFAERLREGTILGAWSDNELVGCVGLAQREKAKLRHKAILWGMFVSPEVRGRGIGKRLLDEAIKQARNSCEEVLLTVVAGNTTASGLYVAAGFVEYGREPGAIKIGASYYDEIMMRLSLRSA